MFGPEDLISSSTVPSRPVPSTVKMHVAVFTSAALLTLGVSAGTINKRNGEGIHLANCVSQGQHFSEMIYYADDSTSGNGGKPYYADECIVTGVDEGYKTWEGSQISCKFPSGVTFTSHLPGGVEWYGTGQYAG